MSKKTPERRTTGKPTQARQVLGEGITITAITLLAFIIYMVAFPFISANLFGLIGTGQTFFLFPDLNNSLDFFGLLAIVLFFGIHLFTTRIIVQKNYIISSSLLAFALSFGIYIFLGNIVLLFWTFIFVPDVVAIAGGRVDLANPSVLQQISDVIRNPTTPVEDISFINLFIFIIIYTLFFLVFTRFLRERRTRRNKSNAKSTK